MVAFYGVALIGSVLIYVIARPLRRAVRIILGVTSFIMFATLITIWFGTLRDDPVEGTRTVTPEEVANPQTTTASSTN